MGVKHFQFLSRTVTGAPCLRAAHETREEQTGKRVLSTLFNTLLPADIIATEPSHSESLHHLFHSVFMFLLMVLSSVFFNFY